MNLSKEQEERLVLGIQAALGILVLALSVRNSAKIKTKEMEKIIARRVKQDGKLAKQEYKWKKKLLAEQYKQKIARESKNLKKRKA